MTSPGDLEAVAGSLAKVAVVVAMVFHYWDGSSGDPGHAVLALAGADKGSHSDEAHKLAAECLAAEVGWKRRPVAFARAVVSHCPLVLGHWQVDSLTSRLLGCRLLCSSRA